MPESPLYGAFFDELEKIAISRNRLRIVAPDRKGRPPIRVETFLKKDREGTLFKATGGEKDPRRGRSDGDRRRERSA